jgi:DNA-binding transcriptional ArsR family regulator
VQAVVQAISEPHRREILRLVRDRELAASEIAGHFDVTRTAISQHLTVLKNAGLISERRDGTRRLYSARPEGLVELRQYVEELWDARLARFLEGFWDEGLAHLKREAEVEERARRRGRGAERN